MKASISLLAIGLAQAWAQAALDITIPAGAAGGGTIQTTIDAEITLDAAQLGALAYTATTTVRRDAMFPRGTFEADMRQVMSTVMVTMWATTTMDGTCAATPVSDASHKD